MRRLIIKIAKLLRSSILKVEKHTIPTIIYQNKMLEGQLAFITGGTSGIGLEIAKEFLRNGAKVIISGSTNSKLEKALNSIKDENLRGIVINVSDPHVMEKKLDIICNIFPNTPLSTLVNCAGVTQKCGFYELTEEEYETIMNVNVKGTYFVSRTISKYMIDNNIKGHILNISSSSALKPAFNAYQISKWAIKGLTIGLAEQLTPYGITVNAIAPGKTATPMMISEGESNRYCEGQPCGRYIEPKEIANLAVFMCSKCGNMIMGDTVYMTGGNGLF